MKAPISITKSNPPETIELMAASVVQIAEASEKILNSGLTKKALIILLQAQIGPGYINKSQIELVLDNLPKLKALYVKK